MLGCDGQTRTEDAPDSPVRCPRDIGATSEDCMEEAKPVPEAWIGQDVHVRYAEADEPRSINCAITEVNDRGLCVEGEGKTAFFPWGNIIKVEMGHLARRTKLGIR